MQQPPPPPLQLSGDVGQIQAPPAWTPAAPARVRGRRRTPRTLVVFCAVLAVVVGVLLGGRISAEDGLRAARDALGAGNAGRAVSLDESIAGRGGALMVLDPGAAAAAAHDGQLARVTWAQQLAAAGDVDGAVTALAQVAEPGLSAKAATVRTQVLLAAATAAVRAGQPNLALARLDEAAADGPPSTMLATIAAMRAADEVPAAQHLLTAGRAVDAIVLLDDASAHGAATAALALYPATLLAAAKQQIAALEYKGAATNLTRVQAVSPRSAEARIARDLLRAPQNVVGTLVDAAGHPAAGRVRLGSHYSVLYGGYQTSGPFYYGIADAAGNFSVGNVPVGGPYVLEYYRGGGWMTLVDPRTDQPANPVTVVALTPVDLTFIVLPN